MVRLVPSGGAFDTMPAAMPPPPPVLFSTVIDWPSRAASLSANSRLTMSGLPPGEVPTRMRSDAIGPVGLRPRRQRARGGETGGKTERVASADRHRSPSLGAALSAGLANLSHFREG